MLSGAQLYEVFPKAGTKLLDPFCALNTCVLMRFGKMDHAATLVPKEDDAIATADGNTIAAISGGISAAPIWFSIIELNCAVTQS